jgi:hypothetical protein
VILRNFFPKGYHAVAAVRLNEEWLILDNRWLTLVRDIDMIRATPEFLLDDNGVHHFIPLKRGDAQRASADICKPILWACLIGANSNPVH